jgi:hypothetical protein
MQVAVLVLNRSFNFNESTRSSLGFTPGCLGYYPQLPLFTRISLSVPRFKMASGRSICACSISTRALLGPAWLSLSPRRPPADDPTPAQPGHARPPSLAAGPCSCCGAQPPTTRQWVDSALRKEHARHVHGSARRTGASGRSRPAQYAAFCGENVSFCLSRAWAWANIVDFDASKMKENYLIGVAYRVHVVLMHPLQDRQDPQRGLARRHTTAAAFSHRQVPELPESDGRSRHRLSELVHFMVHLEHAAVHVACEKRHSVFEFNLCLSRAYLGKMMHFIYQWRKSGV